MVSYFKPLRRKIGVVTLLMACVFAGGWFRSLEDIDSLFIVKSKSVTSLESLNGTIRWEETTCLDRVVPAIFFRRFPNGYSHGKTADITLFMHDYDGPRSYWELAGFDCISGERQGAYHRYRRELWIIPYWSIVIPLTVLSAWLLLRKPPTAKHPVNGDVPS